MSFELTESEQYELDELNKIADNLLDGFSMCPEDIDLAVYMDTPDPATWVLGRIVNLKDKIRYGSASREKL